MIRCRPLPFALRSLLIAWLILTPGSWLLTPALGQSATATLSGIIVDENGAAVPAVNVTVLNVATSIKRETTTNESGNFTVPLLSPGTYALTAMHDGFKAVEVRDLVLNVGDERALRIQMKVGDVKETVNITGEAPLINESPAVGTVVDRQFVANLPLNGRSFQTLIELTPGTVLTKANSLEQGQFSVNGQRPDANYFTVDGVSANIATSGSAGPVIGQSTAGALAGLSALGGTNNLVSVDALQEFKVQTSTYAPEFGRTPGAQVSIVTRSGTNKFHGTLFEYFRNDVLDASDWFANSGGLPKPKERQNDFGGVLGGPLYLPRFGEGGPAFDRGKNNTFFFFSYEGLRLLQPQIATTLVPSVSARQSASGAGLALLNAFPLPNGPEKGASKLARFSASYSNPSTLDATSIRVDHTVSNRLTLFARYNSAPSETIQRGGSFLGLSTLNLTSLNTQTLTGGATFVVSPALSNDIRLNYSRNRLLLRYDLDSFAGAVPPPDSLLFPPSTSSENSLSQFGILGGLNTKLFQGRSNEETQRQLNVVDNVSLLKGPHQLKFGLDYRRLFPISDPGTYANAILFFSVSQVLANTTGLLIPITFAGKRYPVFTNDSLFAQDAWKAGSRLTLTYGLRWDVNSAPSEANGNNPFALVGIDNPATLALAPSGVPLYKTRYGNFAPRVGAAYQVLTQRGHETVIRGGLGVFYDLGYANIANAFSAAFPNNVFKVFLRVPFPPPPNLLAPPALNLNPPYGFIQGVDPNLKLPYVYQWNVALERSLGVSQTVSASYVGAVGRRLIRIETLQNPNPNFRQVVVMRNTSTSDYHALQLQFQRRLSRGLQALASFVWSHSIDTASSDVQASVPITTLDPSADRGPSDFDVRHSFTAAITYNIPKANSGTFAKALLRDWAVDSIFRARSALPVNVLTGANFANVFGVGRPDLIPGMPLYVNDPSVGGGRRINPAAFSNPPAGPNGSPNRQGTLGRNALRGFGMWQLDFALRRQFSLTEHLRLQVRAEAFNLFNHPNFGDPTPAGTNTLASPLFGQSATMLGRSLGTSTGGFSPLYQVGGPRSIQMAVKLSF